MLPSLRPREQMRSDLIGFLLYAIAEDPLESGVNTKKTNIDKENGRSGTVSVSSPANELWFDIANKTQLAR